MEEGELEVTINHCTKRNLVKALGLIGASMAMWKKPVVDVVSLPAHGATSGRIYNVEFTRLSELQSTQPDFDYVSVCAIVTNGLAQVTFQPMVARSFPPEPESDVVRTGIIPTDGNWAALSAVEPCSNTARAVVQARISDIDEHGLTLEVDRSSSTRGTNNIIRIVPAGDHCFTVFSPYGDCRDESPPECQCE